MYFKRMSGETGSVTIPTIGLTVGTMSNWTLTRREDATPGSGDWDLRAVFSYVNEFAFNSQSYAKQITVTIGSPKRGKQFRLEATQGGRTVLAGRSLLIERVSLTQWPS